MRKTFVILLLLGVVAFLGQGSAIAATTWTSLQNVDIVDEDMNLGNDYTRSWKEMGYNSNVGVDKDLINPCPQWTTPGYGGDNCAALAFTTYDPYFKPVTGYGDPMLSTGATLYSDGTIVDDLYSYVVDNWVNGAWVGTLDQDLDMLFATSGTAVGNVGVQELNGDEGAHNPALLVDEGLDQQFAYWEDDGDNVLETTSENGITQRLVIDFAKLNTPVFTEYGIVDQWVVQWLRDIDTGGIGNNNAARGIDQYYSSWFEIGIGDGSTTYDCAGAGVDCSHTYNLSHDSVTKGVDKTIDHDHNPNDN